MIFCESLKHVASVLESVDLCVFSRACQCVCQSAVIARSLVKGIWRGEPLLDNQYSIGPTHKFVNWINSESVPTLNRYTPLAHVHNHRCNISALIE